MDKIHDVVGISCKGFEKQFEVLTAIEEGQPFLAKSSYKKIGSLRDCPILSIMM